MNVICEDQNNLIRAAGDAGNDSNRTEESSRAIFLILLGQLIFLALCSLPAQTGIVFIPPFHTTSGLFGGDYFDFHNAAIDWIHGVNPYLRPRFFTPPPSLLAGLAFLWLPFRAARFFFFLTNIVIIATSVRACSRRLGLSEQCVRYMTGITLLFYPTYFLLERGNLEGLVLGCLAWAFCTRNRYVRAVLIGLAGGLKLFPLLLLVPALWNKLWRLAIGSLISFVLLLMPFNRLIGSFVHAVVGRGGRLELWNNISPAGIIAAIVGLHSVKWIFLAYWAGTLVLMLHHHATKTDERVIWPFVPWMISFPMTVYTYSAVLLLPVLAWKLRDMQNQKETLLDTIFIAGFLLVSIQIYAITRYIPVPQLVVMNSLGMCLILGSLAMQNHRSLANA